MKNNKEPSELPTTSKKPSLKSGSNVYIPKSPPKHSNSPYKSPSPNAKGRTKTAGPEEIKELAEKHYNQAMKYVYKKNDQHAQMVRREQEKSRPQVEQLTEEHTFHPQVRANKYNRKIEEGKASKEVELSKWGINHQAIRREKVIRGEIEVMRSSLEKQYRSLENSRGSSLENSSIEKRTKATADNMLRTHEPKTDKIPGVRKFYLNQARAQVSKTSKERLLFKGNETMGFYF